MDPIPERTTAAARPDSPGPIRYWGVRLALAAGAPIFAVLALEAGLRAFGFGFSPDLFIRDDRPGYYRTNPSFTDSFFPASFGQKPQNFRLPKEKPKDALRIFVVGESAALGVPEAGFGIGPQLRAQLMHEHPGRRFEVYNLGITAINSHIVRNVVRQALGFGPDLLVVYMGNNEVVGPFGPGSDGTGRMHGLGLIRASIWLRGTRTGQLMRWLLGRLLRGGASFTEWRGMETFSGRTVGADDPRLQAVYSNFAGNLADILACARRAGVKVVLSTVAVNVRDCSPFASRHRLGLSAADLDSWRRAFDGAERAEDLGSLDRAEELASNALWIDPGHADTHFLMARILDERGEVAAARPHYLEALREDALRFRADARTNEIIREQAKAAGAPAVAFVDAALSLGSDAASSAPPAGADLFLEHVHLTWEGNYALSRLLAEGAERSLFGDSPPAPWLTSAQCADAVGFTRFGRVTMLLRMLGPDGRPPFTGQLTFAADRTRLDQEILAENTALDAPGGMADAVARIESARERDPGPFLFSHEAAADIRLGNLAAALDRNERAAALLPPSSEEAVQRAFILQQLGRAGEAESLLLRTARTDPYYFQTYSLLANGWEQGRQVAQGKAYFSALLEQMPGSRNAQLPYAGFLAATGDWDGAERQWRDVLARVPDEEGALEPLVGRLAAEHRAAEGLDLMQRAFAYNPRSYPNNLRLVQYFESRGDLANLVKYMSALSESGPVSPRLYADLASALFVLGRRDEAAAALFKARRGADRAGDSALLQSVGELARKNGLR